MWFLPTLGRFALKEERMNVRFSSILSFNLFNIFLKNMCVCFRHFFSLLYDFVCCCLFKKSKEWDPSHHFKRNNAVVLFNLTNPIPAPTEHIRVAF